MEAPMSLLLLLFALLLLAGQRRCTASGAGGFSVEFIHRDSAMSPFHDPVLSSHGRVLAAARRSLQAGRSRGLPPAAAPVPADGVVSEVISRSFEYLMAVNVGTPPRKMLAIADTGSDLVWVNCRNNGSDDRREPTSDGAAAPPPAAVFDPSSSSTYALVSCQSNACQALNEASCDAVSNCRYQYAYGDGSRTIGLLATETFSFVDGRGGDTRPVGVPNVNFGCSTYTAGTFHSDGLVGLGGGAFSFVTQLGAATPFGSKFSYCLVAFSAGNGNDSSSSSSSLNFGARAVVSEPGAATTPLVRSDVDAYYTVALESVAVGGRTVATHTSRIIVDSGTTLTFLDTALLRPLVSELERRITLPRAQSPEQLLELCYDVRGKPQGEWGIPDVTLRFGGGGGEVTLRAENTFAVVQEATLCLAVVPVSESQPVSILGNVAQQNFHVGYDLDARTVTFAAADCTRSSAS